LAICVAIDTSRNPCYKDFGSGRRLSPA
jgi:hypothetical protein